MEKIKSKFEQHKKESSDINEHLQTLYDYSTQCDTIIEMGVRWVSSTWAFLMSKPNKFISYDIVKHENINEVIYLSKEYNIDYKFIENDVLNVKIDKTDLLFLDTLHTYNQLHSELLLHSPNVLKYIIMHDTVSFGYVDENIYNHASDIIKSVPKTKQGLKNAINDFLLTEIGSEWEILTEYVNNNGLLILKRK
jgi:hypothetical protein